MRNVPGNDQFNIVLKKIRRAMKTIEMKAICPGTLFLRIFL